MTITVPPSQPLGMLAALITCLHLSMPYLYSNYQSSTLYIGVDRKQVRRKLLYEINCAMWLLNLNSRVGYRKLNFGWTFQWGQSGLSVIRDLTKVGTSVIASPPPRRYQVHYYSDENIDPPSVISKPVPTGWGERRILHVRSTCISPKLQIMYLRSKFRLPRVK
jgi:hypothetical protein